MKFTQTLSLIGLLCLGALGFVVVGGQEKKGEEPDVAERLAEIRVQNPPGLRLELKAAKTQDKDLEKHTLTAELINDGKKDITLVKPGDGSTCAWRTPAVQWNINRAAPSGLVARCGNINSLAPNEVFTLKPGQRFKLDGWIGQPSFAGTGKFVVSLRYANLPDLQWRGLPLGKHDVAEMDKVKKSTPVNLVSNEVEIILDK